MLTDTQLWWFVARASGIVSWSLLAASVLWGLALSTKILGSRPRANWLLDLHRYLGGLALVFTGVHVGSLVLDSYVHFGLTEILVPLTSSYRPGAVAWGVVSLYLLLAVEITSLLRSRLSNRLWRRTHFLSFPLFAAATAHGLLAGSDSTGRVMFAAMAVVTALVAGLTIARVDQSRRSGAKRPRRASSASTPSSSRRNALSPATRTSSRSDRSRIHAQPSEGPSAQSTGGPLPRRVATGAASRPRGRDAAPIAH